MLQHVSRRLLCQPGMALFLIGISGLGFWLTACSFSPLYRQDITDSVTPKMAMVDIGIIKDRQGQILRNQLLTAFNPYGSPPNPFYRLEIALNKSVGSSGIQADDTRTRGILTIRATINLKNLATGKIIYKAQTAFTNAFDILPNTYSTLVSERDAEKKVLTLLTQDIKTRIALVLKDEPSLVPPTL